MSNRLKAPDRSKSNDDIRIKQEIDRTNARLRHFRGIAASVMFDAFNLWQEIWESCQDSRSCIEIIEGLDAEPTGQAPACGWPELMEKLHLLGHYLDYAKRLCDGTIDDDSKKESEV
jgi:hypothetical protein